MGHIRILPEIIANKIAAGEVIERPASIVKELVENSLDAGAQTVEIVIRHGGKSLIRVSDDGSGMNAEDAELAFQRHATSKIMTEEDLDRILSYGFRGEALPSIAAVSRVKLTTGLKGGTEGTEIVIEGGRSKLSRRAASKSGTVLEVKDLFFNTPARRKFMKSDATEAGHIEQTLAHLALSRLDVHFIYKSQDKLVFELLPGLPLAERAKVLLGAEVADHLLDFEGEDQGVKISGIIGKPHLARANKSGQSFFINQRWVRSFSLSYGLQAAYHGMLMHGQYPVGIVFIVVNPERVDVNVHPTKQEVRLSNESQVKNLIQRAVSTKLNTHPHLAPSVKSVSQDLVSPLYSSNVQPLEWVKDSSVPLYGSHPKLPGFHEEIALPTALESELETPIFLSVVSF